MAVVGQVERKTQDRVVELFRNQMGYEYLGNWEYRDDNAHVEEKRLETNLLARGYDSNLTNKAIDALTEVITSVIAKGNPVALIGFGTFKSVMRSARTGKNPKTGAPLKIAAKAVPKFSAGAGLKAAVAGKKPVAKKAPAKKAPAAKKPAAKPAAKKPAAKKK